LNITISDSENSVIKARPTENLIAYQAYLRGLDYLKYSHAPEDQYNKAQKMFEQAAELDPNFTLAFVKLSETHRSLYFFGYDRTRERIEKAREAVETALQIQPDLAAAHVELGYLYYHGSLDYDLALSEFSIAAKSLPNNSALSANIAFVWRRQGLFEQAIDNLEQALALSPNDASLMAELAHSYLSVRKYEDALRYCDQCMAAAPDNKWAYLLKYLGRLAWKGDLDGAGSVLDEMPDKQSPYSILFMFLQEMYEGNYQGALDNLTVLPGEVIEVQSDYIPKSSLAGWAYSSLRDSLRAESSFASARALLERAIQKQPDDPLQRIVRKSSGTGL
jgi:tetratricopeptide (TPR) repeat protein